MTQFLETCRDLFESPLVVVDVGAAGGVNEVEGLASLCEMHAVEPRADSFRELVVLNEQGHYAKSFSYSKGLAKVSGRQTLYVTRIPEASSIYRPNTSLVDRWRGDGAFDVVAEESIDCITLKEMLIETDIDHIDLIKIDTQGSELGVLLGAGDCLDRISIIKCEVEFVELYEGQPLFDDLVRELSGQGFRFVDFFDGAFVGRAPDKGKRIWGDAMFIKKSFDQADKLIKAAAILVEMGHCEEARWLLLDSEESVENWQRMIDARVIDQYPKARFFKKTNEIFKSISKKSLFLESIRQLLIKQLLRTRFGNALTKIRR
jgi:FkbM family methyltransferase